MPRPSGSRKAPASTRRGGWVADVGASSSTLPAVGATSPATTAHSVDLPAPLAPSSARISPRLDGQVDAAEHLDVAVAGAQAPSRSTGGRHRRRRRGPTRRGTRPRTTGTVAGAPRPRARPLRGRVRSLPVAARRRWPGCRRGSGPAGWRRGRTGPGAAGSRRRSSPGSRGSAPRTRRPARRRRGGGRRTPPPRPARRGRSRRGSRCSRPARWSRPTARRRTRRSQPTGRRPRASCAPPARRSVTAPGSSSGAPRSPVPRPSA